jgi:hypothetical protein
MLHYLRIAVTALSLTACVLLVALWVRSYWRIEFATTPYVATGILSMRGELLAVFSLDVSKRPDEWHFESDPIPDDVELPPLRRFLGFGYYGTAFEHGLLVPHWFAVLVSTFLAAAPWMRRPYRFSIRTLLIATTLVAAGLGIVVATR